MSIADEINRRVRTAAPLEEVRLERLRQDAKWGEQNHPDLARDVRHMNALSVAEEMCLPSADVARQRVELLARAGELGYADIALEEFCEAIEAAANEDVGELRKELIQTAAVLVAWVECIDRRRHRAGGGQ